MVNYTKAKRYAAKCGYGTDLVHDAYLTWYKKTGNNLFLEPEHRVMAVMGWTVRATRNQGMQMWRGTKYYRKYINVPEIDKRGGEWTTNEYLTQVEPNQVDYCSYNETTNDLERKFEGITGFTRIVYDYLKNGYCGFEIAKAEKTSIQRIHHHIKKVRWIGITGSVPKGDNHYNLKTPKQ